MPQSTLRLVSATQNFRAGTVSLQFETKNIFNNILASIAFKNASFMKQLRNSDRERVAYWAGVEETRMKASQIQLLKELLAKPPATSKEDKNNKALKNA